MLYSLYMYNSNVYFESSPLFSVPCITLYYNSFNNNLWYYSSCSFCCSHSHFLVNEGFNIRQNSIDEFSSFSYWRKRLLYHVFTDFLSKNTKWNVFLLADNDSLTSIEVEHFVRRTTFFIL